MKLRKSLQLALFLLLLLPLFCLPVAADAGPKPSVTVTLEGLEGRACWGTLLSEIESTGPYGALGPADWQSFSDGTPGEAEAYRAFLSLSPEENEGFFVLNFLQDCSGGTFSWTYYPPSVFKLALWFPEEETLVVGPVCSRYAFDSHYRLDLSQVSLAPGETVVLEQLPRDYPYAQELLALVGRIVLTCGIELAMAFWFGLTAREQQKWIAGVNLITQGLLNLGLNLFTYFCGSLAGIMVIFALPAYLLLELLVVAVELNIYRRVLPRWGSASRGQITSYTWAANAVSCLVGILLSFFLEPLF